MTQHASVDVGGETRGSVLEFNSVFFKPDESSTFDNMGLTDTFTGVACVSKMGTPHSDKVFRSGPRTPFPIQTNRS